MMSKCKVLISDDRKEYFAKMTALFGIYDFEVICAPKDGVRVLRNHSAE